MSNAPTVQASPRRQPRLAWSAGHLRWGIALLLGVGILVNYFDRVNMSVAGTGLRDAFGMNPAQLGILLSSFTWSYGLTQIPIGLLLDKIGVKWIMRVTSVLWGIATLLTAVVSGFGLILVTRLLLGVAEAPAIVSSQKTTG